MRFASGEFHEYVKSIPIIDTHEHFCFPGFLAQEKRDVLTYLQNTYLADDLRSVGFDKEQWSVIEPPNALAIYSL